MLSTGISGDARLRKLGELTPMVRRLSFAYHELDGQQLWDAVEDAALELGADAEDAVSREILYASAWRNARDIIRSEHARKQRECRWAQHRHAISDSDPHEAAETLRILQHACNTIESLLPDEQLRTVFRLRSTGEHDMKIYAAKLGLETAAPERQAKEVRKQQDRLNKYLKRHRRIREIARHAVLAVRGEV